MRCSRREWTGAVAGLVSTYANGGSLTSVRLSSRVQRSARWHRKKERTESLCNDCIRSRFQPRNRLEGA